MTQKNDSPPAKPPAGGGYPTRVLLVFLAIGTSIVLGFLSIVGTLLPALRGWLLEKARTGNWSEGAQHFIDRLPETAEQLFNSRPLMVLWIFLFMTLVLGVLFSPKIIRRGGSLAVHVGAILILAGSMWSSQAGHLLAAKLVHDHPTWAKYLDAKAVRKGQLVVSEGQTENRLNWPQGATLPFSVKLNDFRIEYYGPWKLRAHVPVMHQLAIGNMEIQDGIRELPTDKGTVLDLPWTPAKVKVIDYLPHTRLEYPDNVPADIVVSLGAGRQVSVPAKPGQTATLALPSDNSNPLLPGPTAMLTVREVFDHLSIVDTPQGGVPMEDPEAPQNPAVSFVVRYSDGKSKLLLVTHQPSDLPSSDRGVEYKYVPRKPAVQVEPLSDDAAVELEVSANGKSERVRLTGQQPLKLPLKTPVGEADYMALSLEEPDLMGIKSFASDVEIIEDGKSVQQATISVNHPLHYKGYHLYQLDYDHDAKQYTKLWVVSDRGLYTVYAGFVLMVAGVFWVYWVRPVIRYVRQRRKNQ